jgi:hypothetical protein
MPGPLGLDPGWTLPARFLRSTQICTCDRSQSRGRPRPKSTTGLGMSGYRRW